MTTMTLLRMATALAATAATVTATWSGKCLTASSATIGMMSTAAASQGGAALATTLIFFHRVESLFMFTSSAGVGGRYCAHSLLMSVRHGCGSVSALMRGRHRRTSAW